MRWGYPRRWLAEAVSTNDLARDWVLSGVPEGAVVSARQQTQGRGRREHVWESKAKAGLYASILLRPGWPASEAPNLAILAGMAAFRALQRAGIKNLRVKWPNDILADGKKICGVLVEPRIGEGHIEYAILGFGVNVHQIREDFSSGLRESATSCAMEGVTIEIDPLLDLLLDSLQVVRRQSMDSLRAEWMAAGAGEQEPEL